MKGCGLSQDCNGNGVPDECEVEGPILFVNDDASGANTGVSWTDALTDLQFALGIAETNPDLTTEVWAAQGTYVPSERTDPEDPRTATFQLQSDLAIYGGFAGFETSLEARDCPFDQTMLTGDLSADDDPIPRTR